MLHLVIVLQHGVSSASHTLTNNRPLHTHTCVDHLRRIRTAHTGRSLVELTGDSDIFNYLHKYFVFLLKAGGQRVTESVLEGPPQVCSVVANKHFSSYV